MVLELLQKPHIVTPEITNVVDLVSQHQLALRSHAKGEACVTLGVVAAVLQNIRVHHAAAQDLQPVLTFAEANLALVAPALDVDLERRLGEWKERRPESHVDV